MHPRRWGRFLACSTTSSGHCFCPTPTPAVQRRWDPGGGRQPAGSWQFQRLLVVTDPNIEINLGTGGNEDPVTGQRRADRLAGGRVPHLHRAVVVAGGDAFAVGAERQTEDCVRCGR
jgi:hypothetical protein